MSIFNGINNPGVDLNQLTSGEVTFLSGLSNLAYEQGDILYYNGTALTVLHHGTAGQVLQSGGHAANPSWATTGAGTGDVIAPATNTDGYIPQWNGANSKTLKDGLAVPAGGLAGLTAPTFATSITGSYLTASEILITDGSKNIVSAPVATYPSLTELSYVKGVTSAIQTQIGNKITNNNAEVGFADLDSELVYPAWRGWIAASLTSASAVVTSNGTTVTLTVQKSGGGDLILLFSTGSITVDCTPALTIALTAGSDISPQINYVYITKAAPTVLTKSTTGFPTAEEFHPIGTFIIESAATVQTYGCFKAHLWTDHIQSTDRNGHLAHVNEWIRSQHATWIDGVQLTPTLTAASPDTLTIATSSGNILQLHSHSFPAFNSATAGTTNLTSFHVVNHPTAYTVGKDLYNFKLTSGNVAASNNDRISWVIWGAVGEADGDCQIFVNLPSGFYTSDASATADGLKYTNYTIPAAYKGTGFLIAKLTYKYNTTGGGDLTLVENLDLRGQLPSTVAGGTSVQNTQFNDNTFEIHDEADGTKDVLFSCGGMTTGTATTLTFAQTANRAITFPDTAGTLPVGTGTANEISYWSGTNTLGTLAVATYPSLTELSYVKGVTSAIQTQLGNLVAKATYDAHTILYATTDNTPVALTVGEQTLVGRATGGNISAIVIDSDLTSVSANDDTVPSAKATKAMGDLKLPLAGGTMSGDITLGENTSLALDPAGSADGKYSGISITGTAGATLAFGDVIVLDVTASKWLLADANSAVAADGDARGLIGMCVLAANDTQATKILLVGTCRADSKFPTLTITAPVYLSETAGAIVVAQPTTTDVVIRTLGFALTADEILFNPSSDYITHT